ncbi:hypothetical protein [Nonomuraea africana]|uniref:hypothetical protein n=1 Tax=Nonomuraea africana TaxID=46171 RepID=UPI0033F40505
MQIAERKSGAIKLSPIEAAPEPRNLRRIKNGVGVIGFDQRGVVCQIQSQLKNLENKAASAKGASSDARHAPGPVVRAARA